MLKAPIFWKIYVSSIILVLITVASIGILTTQQIEEFELKSAENELTVYANLLKDLSVPALHENQKDKLQQQVKDLSERLSARLTVVAPDGTVVGDSSEAPIKMDNHGTRPEIVAAKTAAVGSSTRYSNTVKQRLMYVAVAVRDNNKIIGYARAAYPLTQIDQQLVSARYIILFGGLLGAALALLIGFFFARQIAYPLNEMTELAESIADGNYNQIISVSQFSDFGNLAGALNKMAKQIESDITERIEAEASLREARAELEKRVEERTLALSELTLSLKKQVFEHKRIEKSLQENELRYRNLVENAVDVLFSCDFEGRFTLINRAGANLLGYSTEEIKKMSLVSIATYGSKDFVSKMIQNCAIGLQHNLERIEVTAKSGRTVWLEINCRSNFHDGKNGGIQAVAREISERTHSKLMAFAAY